MKPEDIKWCPQHGYPLPCDKCGMPLTKLQQKEIYKAGMRGVVEWINSHCDLEHCNPEDVVKEWQAFCKERGL